LLDRVGEQRDLDLVAVVVARDDLHPLVAELPGRHVACVEQLRGRGLVRGTGVVDAPVREFDHHVLDVQVEHTPATGTET